MARGEASLLNALHRFFPSDLPKKLGEAVTALLSQELGAACSVELEKLTSSEVTPYVQTLTKQGVVIVLGLASHEERGFCEIDLFFAHALIDRLLGGEGEPLKTLRPLTEIEQGVFSYLVLKILSVLYDLCGESPRAHFRLQEFCSSPQEVTRFIAPQSRLMILYWKVQVGMLTGSVRLVFPAAFIQKNFSPPLETSILEASSFAKSLQALGFIRTRLWADAGRSSVRQSELAGLKEGDVVLLDQAEVSLHDGKVVGHVNLRVGTGENSSFHGKILDDEGGRFRVQLEGSHREHPVENL